MKEVEILKIGKIMPIIPIKGTRVYDTSQFSKPTIMVVCDGGPIFDYYVSMLKENCDEYRYLNTAQIIVGNQHTLKGIPDSDPIVGKPYSINNGWYISGFSASSIVKKIINDNLLISEKSVYVIHDFSQLRDKKLSDLGI